MGQSANPVKLLCGYRLAANKARNGTAVKGDGEMAPRVPFDGVQDVLEQKPLALPA